MDPSIGISEKILLNDDKKPQAKHLQARTEYLLKILKNLLNAKQGVVSFLKHQHCSLIYYIIKYLSF
jgi:hypothetical protein